MKRLLILLALISSGVFTGEPEICKPDEMAKKFLSIWKEQGRAIAILSNIRDSQVSVEEGIVAYQGDLNGDGNEDYIFESLSSAGSAGDRTFDILIQCKGYLKFSGGDYFAGVREIRSGNLQYKDIVFDSYRRDKEGKIAFKGKQALTRSHVWRFNPQVGKYEGDMD